MDNSITITKLEHGFLIEKAGYKYAYEGLLQTMQEVLDALVGYGLVVKIEGDGEQ